MCDMHMLLSFSGQELQKHISHIDRWIEPVDVRYAHLVISTDTSSWAHLLWFRMTHHHDNMMISSSCDFSGQYFTICNISHLPTFNFKTPFILPNLTPSCRRLVWSANVVSHMGCSRLVEWWCFCIYKKVYAQTKASTLTLEKTFKNAHATLCSAVQNLRLGSINLPTFQTT